MWNNCTNLEKRDKGGRPKINQTEIENINAHVGIGSTVASNRYLKKLKSCASYRQISIKKSFETFPRKSSLSFTTFYKYILKKYKNPHRLTDLCEMCELNKV